MTKRKTDGERIADRLFGLALDDQEPKWLAAEIDRLVRRRMAEAWDEGNISPGHLKDNPYRKRREKA